MSEALRAMADRAAADAQSADDDLSPQLEDEAQQPESQQPPEPELDDQAPPPPPEPKPVAKKAEKAPTKFQQQRTLEQQLEDSRQKGKRQSEELAAVKNQLVQLQASLDARAKQEQEEQDPIKRVLKQGYRPEDARKKAASMEAEGDLDGAVAARKFAEDMQAELDRQGQEQQAQAQRHMVPGTNEFNEVWKAQEANLVRIENQSPDPEDRELIKQFAVNGTEVDKRLKDFFANDPIGQAVGQNNHGIYYAYNVIKSAIKIERRDRIIAKLNKELGRSTALTSLGGGAPASTNGSTGKKRFEDMTTDEMRAELRGRIQD